MEPWWSGGAKTGQDFDGSSGAGAVSKAAPAGAGAGYLETFWRGISKNFPEAPAESCNHTHNHRFAMAPAQAAWRNAPDEEELERRNVRIHLSNCLSLISRSFA